LQRSCKISTATEQDLERLGEWGYVFNELYGAGIMEFNGETFKQRLRVFMETGVGTVLCAHEGLDGLCGAIAGLFYPDIFADIPTAAEIFWYVLPGSPKGTGTQLLEAFEEWAKRRGAKRVSMAYMVHNQPERLRAFYEKRGYRAFETFYVKAI
jgi:GNAT superfamily N-acetyltransferase